MQVKIGDHVCAAGDVAVLQDALDLYQRMQMGQFSDIAHHLKLCNPDYDPEVLEALSACQSMMFNGHTTKSFGLHNSNVSRRAVEAHRMELLLQGKQEEAESESILLEEMSSDDSFGGFDECQDGAG